MGGKRQLSRGNKKVVDQGASYSEDLGRVAWMESSYQGLRQRNEMGREQKQGGKKSNQSGQNAKIHQQCKLKFDA